MSRSVEALKRVPVTIELNRLEMAALVEALQTQINLEKDAWDQGGVDALKVGILGALASRLSAGYKAAGGPL